MAPMPRWASILILLAACRNPGTGAPKPPAADTREAAVEIRYDVTPVTQAVEGEMALVRLKVRNVSSKYYVFVKSVLDPDSGTAIHWQRSRGGAVRYDAKEDEYLHDRTASEPSLAEPLETPEIFNHGFLAPAHREDGKLHQEDLDVHLHIRLIRLPKQLRIEYFAFTRDEVLRNLYFLVPKKTDPTGQAPKEDRYTRVNEAYLDQYVRFRHVNPAQAMLHKEDVIYPMVVYAPVIPARILVSCPIRPRPFPASMAAAKAGVSEGDVRTFSYSNAFDAWLLQMPDGKVILVDAQGAESVGRAELSIFDAMDMPPADGVARDLVEIVFFDSTEDLFLTEYKPDRSKPRSERLMGAIYPANTRAGVRYFLNLRRADFRKFLRDCGLFELTLTRDARGRVGVRRKGP